MTYLVKRYAGVRLYDTQTLSYTSAEALRAMRAKGAAVVVRDAGTGADVTAATLD